MVPPNCITIWYNTIQGLWLYTTIIIIIIEFKKIKNSVKKRNRKKEKKGLNQ